MWWNRFLIGVGHTVTDSSHRRLHNHAERHGRRKWRNPSGYPANPHLVPVTACQHSRIPLLRNWIMCKLCNRPDWSKNGPHVMFVITSNSLHRTIIRSVIVWSSFFWLRACCSSRWPFWYFQIYPLQLDLQQYRCGLLPLNNYPRWYISSMQTNMDDDSAGATQHDIFFTPRWTVAEGFGVGRGGASTDHGTGRWKSQNGREKRYLYNFANSYDRYF